MTYHKAVICSEMHIEFNAVHALFLRTPQGLQRVFVRCKVYTCGAKTAMGQNLDLRFVLAAAGQQHAKRREKDEEFFHIPCL